VPTARNSILAYVTTTGTPTLVSGVPGELGTSTGTDGTKQVTSNGMPLNYFAKDGDAGDTWGEGSPSAAATREARAASNQIKGFVFSPGSWCIG